MDTDGKRLQKKKGRDPKHPNNGRTFSFWKSLQKAACDGPGATAGEPSEARLSLPSGRAPIQASSGAYLQKSTRAESATWFAGGTLHHLLEQKLTQQASIPGLLLSSPTAPGSLQEGSFHSVQSSEDLAAVLLLEPPQPSARSSPRVGGAKANKKTVRGNGRLFAPFIFFCSSLSWTLVMGGGSLLNDLVSVKLATRRC